MAGDGAAALVGDGCCRAHLVRAGAGVGVGVMLRGNERVRVGVSVRVRVGIGDVALNRLGAACAHGARSSRACLA